MVLLSVIIEVVLEGEVTDGALVPSTLSEFISTTSPRNWKLQKPSDTEHVVFFCSQ